LSDEIIFLRKQEVIDIHAQLIIAFGGSEGLRDEGALSEHPPWQERRRWI
jgi:hypothetical protein